MGSKADTQRQQEKLSCLIASPASPRLLLSFTHLPLEATESTWGWEWPLKSKREGEGGRPGTLAPHPGPISALRGSWLVPPTPGWW